MVEFFQENYMLIIIALVVILIVLPLAHIIFKRVAKGQLKALKPLIEKLMVEIEIIAQDEDIKKAGKQKLADVVKGVKLALQTAPKPFCYIANLVSDEDIENICEEVFSEIGDTLAEKCKEYRENLLLNNTK